MSTEPRDARVAPNDFDNAMRRLHVDAVDHVSAPVRARLRTARTTATSPSRRSLGWALASGLAAMCALVIGLQLRTPATPTAVTPAAIATITESTVYDADTAVAALEENPDFYLWLASTDVDLEQ